MKRCIVIEREYNAPFFEDFIEVAWRESQIITGLKSPTFNDIE